MNSILNKYFETTKYLTFFRKKKVLHHQMSRHINLYYPQDFLYNKKCSDIALNKNHLSLHVTSFDIYIVKCNKKMNCTYIR